MEKDNVETISDNLWLKNCDICITKGICNYNSPIRTSEALWESRPSLWTQESYQVGQTKQLKAGWFKPEPKEKKAETMMRKDIYGII